jgi:hypothetical protein
MAFNIAGYNLSNSSGIVFGGSTSKVDSAGRLISPTNPATWAAKIGTASASRQYPWVANNATMNIGTHWNTSTGVFTCPVAGLYYMAWSGICQGGASTVATTTLAGYVGVIKNGSLVTYSHWNTCNYWEGMNLETIVPCAVNDTLSFAINIAPAPVNGTSGAYGDNHNSLCIWLIG